MSINFKKITKFVFIKRILSIAILVSFFTSISNNAISAFNIPVSVAGETILTLRSGTIIDEYTNLKNNNLVICIQDAHCNYEVQKNINSILEDLKSYYKKLYLVGVEGTSGAIDTSIGEFPVHKVRTSVLDDFLKSSDITGAEYFGLNNYKDVQLYGIEAKDLYLANFEALYGSFDFRQASQNAYNEFKEVLDLARLLIYTKPLKEFEKAKRDYMRGKISLYSHVKYLENLCSKNEIDFRKEFQQASLFLEIKRHESKLNTNVLNTELKNLLNALNTFITKEEFEKLTETQDTSQKYYEYLSKIITKNRINIERAYPNTYEYLKYTEKLANLKQGKFFEELKDLSYKIKQKLAGKSHDLKKLIDCFNNFELMKKYFNNNATSVDADKWQQNKEKFIEDFKYINRCVSTRDLYGKYKQAIDGQQNLMETFYKAADKRNEVMVANLLELPPSSSLPKRDSENVSIMIIGGYHTDGVTQALRNRGISYKVIMPDMGQSDTKGTKNLYEQKIKEQAKWMMKSDNTFAAAGQKDKSKVSALALWSKLAAPANNNVTVDVKNKIVEGFVENLKALLSNNDEKVVTWENLKEISKNKDTLDIKKTQTGYKVRIGIDGQARLMFFNNKGQYVDRAELLAEQLEEAQHLKGKKVLFLNGGSGTAKNIIEKESKRQNPGQQNCFESVNLRLPQQFLKLQRKIDKNTVIYICGHGGSGKDYLETKANGLRTRKYHFSDLAKAINEALPNNYQGTLKIKLIMCNAALDRNGNISAEHSFAGKLANAVKCPTLITAFAESISSMQVEREGVVKKASIIKRARTEKAKLVRGNNGKSKYIPRAAHEAKRPVPAASLPSAPSNSEENKIDFKKILGNLYHASIKSQEDTVSYLLLKAKEAKEGERLSIFRPSSRDIPYITISYIEEGKISHTRFRYEVGTNKYVTRIKSEDVPHSLEQLQDMSTFITKQGGL
ncbi:hypothetical protein ACFL4A_04860, partial [bacterium]